MSKFILNPGGIAALEATGGPVDAVLRLKAELVATEAKRLVNVDNGRLKGSITTVPGRDPKGQLQVLIGSNVEYALFQELEVGATFPAGGPYAGKTRVRAGGKAYLRPALASVMARR